jgi:hypothetical protein
MKIRPVEAEFLHADGWTQTDMTKLIVTSRNFTIAPVKANESLSAGWKVSDK